MKFLVIDDSAMDRYLIMSILQKLGHQADACSTPQGALEKIAQENYSAVFLDIVMPEEDGYKFLRKLRSTPNTSEQYVVFCSSKKTNLEINYGLRKAGANDYLVKPVNQKSLREILAKI